MNSVVFVILTALAFGLAVTAKEPQCYVEGECLDSQLVNLTLQDNYNQCLKDCQHNTECQWFTFEGSQNSCLLFSNCNTLSDSTCQYCYSGEKTCQPKLDCNLNGICQVNNTLNFKLKMAYYVSMTHLPLQGTILGAFANKTTSQCHLTCQSNKECMWFSYSQQQNLCIIFNTCPVLGEDSDFVSSHVNCEMPNTRILIATGLPHTR